MQRHTPADPQAVLSRLMGRVDRIAHHVETALEGLDRLTGDVDAHTRTLADLTALIRQGSTTSATATSARTNGAAPAAPTAAPIAEWLTVTDPAVAVAWLAALNVWTHRVWTHYQALPACWAWHAPVVAELLACQQVWVKATAPDATPDALAAWHDRWRPSTARHITGQLTACERTGGSHVLAAGTRYRIDPTVTDELAVWWATTHGTTPAPGLTREDTR